MSGLFVQTIFADYIASRLNDEPSIINRHHTQLIMDELRSSIFTTGHDPAEPSYVYSTGFRDMVRDNNENNYIIQFIVEYDTSFNQADGIFDYQFTSYEQSYFKHTSDGTWLSLNEREKTFIIIPQLDNRFINSHLE